MKVYLKFIRTNTSKIKDFTRYINYEQKLVNGKHHMQRTKQTRPYTYKKNFKMWTHTLLNFVYITLLLPFMLTFLLGHIKYTLNVSNWDIEQIHYRFLK